jgi:chromosomal replication initiation ATPase DnaA
MKELNKQLVLDIHLKPSFEEENFIINEANYEAKTLVDSWPHWNFKPYANILVIIGPHSSGKSHLAAIWQKKSAARKITNADLKIANLPTIADSYLLELNEIKDISDEDLFLFINYVINENKSLLLTCYPHDFTNRFKLPDLVSRFRAFKSVEIKKPSEQLISELIFKHFSDQHINLSPRSVKFISNRIGRNYSEMFLILKKLEEASLEKHKKISIYLVKKVLNI